MRKRSKVRRVSPEMDRVVRRIQDKFMERGVRMNYADATRYMARKIDKDLERDVL